MENTFNFEELNGYHLPEYNEIPDIGLYLNQTVKYINSALAPVEVTEVTESMVSNYVKKHLIDSPVKKMYSRKQIAYLIYISLAKTVLSLEDIQLLITIAEENFDSSQAYQTFKEQFENILYTIFKMKDSADEFDINDSEYRAFLNTTIIAMVHKIYLEKTFAAYRKTQSK